MRSSNVGLEEKASVCNIANQMSGDSIQFNEMPSMAFLSGVQELKELAGR
jgi:hypothetical protein